MPGGAQWGYLAGCLPLPLNSFPSNDTVTLILFALILGDFEMIIMVYNLPANERHLSIKTNV
jgi:hypothetical protein